MNHQKLFGGFAAALLVSTFGVAPSGYADQAGSTDAESGEKVSVGTPTQSVAQTEPSKHLISNNPPQPSADDRADDRKVATPAETAPASLESNSASPSNQPAPAGSAALGESTAPASSTAPGTAEALNSPASPQPQSDSQTEPQPNTQSSNSSTLEAVKVGEYQSQASSEAGVATIQSHPLQGRQAATLYVRNIPVLTFLGSAPESSGSAESAGAEVKIASVQNNHPPAQLTAAKPAEASSTTNPAASPAEPAATVAPDAPNTTPNPEANNRDPVWRATTTAARLNQLHRDNVNASDIKISWNAERQQYVITANEVEVVAIDGDTVLPDTVENAAGDLLQATNRIRRQMGNAAPLSNIEGDPNGVRQVSLGPVSVRVSGYASWYGPGFDGAYSASGEVFNQEALTAAHPSLPFGTQVKVTNADNGESVVVRINDRGPFAADRVIDLSAGAARVIGLIQSGVAPVSLEVLGAAGSK